MKQLVAKMQGTQQNVKHVICEQKRHGHEHVCTPCAQRFCPHHDDEGDMELVVALRNTGAEVVEKLLAKSDGTFASGTFAMRHRDNAKECALGGVQRQACPPHDDTQRRRATDNQQQSLRHPDRQRPEGLLPFSFSACLASLLARVDQAQALFLCPLPGGRQGSQGRH